MNNLFTKAAPIEGPKHFKLLLAGLAILFVATAARASTPTHQASSMGTAVAYPFEFQDGDSTSRATALETGAEILQKAGYDTITSQRARNAWSNGTRSSFGNLPSNSRLEAFGTRLHAKVVMFGSVSWHTRSIWVDLGPKTISTATVDMYIFDVAAHKIVYSSIDVAGRSDEKENAYKVAADILITPLVTVVSGGPATPHEQRAVQIALGRAMHEWVHPGSANQ
jgi:hypothetical protein